MSQKKIKIFELIREKHHRLPWYDYKSAIAVVFTLCIGNRDFLFNNPDIFRLFEGILLNESNKKGCNAEAYVFMPDHCHILLSGKDVHSDCLRTIIAFKQRTGYWLSRNNPAIRWQKDFYDHILREEEDLEKHILYILNNPVRAGLVQDWKQYPYKGSAVYNFEEFE